MSLKECLFLIVLNFASFFVNMWSEPPSGKAPHLNLKNYRIMKHTVLLLSALVASFAASAAEVTKPQDYLTLHKVNDGIYTMRVKPTDIKFFEIDMKNLMGETGNPRAQRWGCSAVTNGRFYGRNLDYFRSNHPLFVVWADRGEGTAAYMGVTTSPQLILNIAEHQSIGKPDIAALEKNTALLKSIPASLLDGVNEHGVACNINMIDAQDSNITDKGTKPGAKVTLNSPDVIPYVLAHATSAHHAVKMLEEANIVFADNSPTLHWMISDKHSTYIVEVKDDKMHITDKHKVMTNYYLTTPELTPHSCGIERADILRKHYNEGTSVEGMRQLMRRVAYSQTYSWNTEPFWYSEFYDNPVKGMHFSLSTPHDDKAFLSYINESIREFNNSTPSHNPYLVWETSYNSVYDMEEKTLRLTPCEKWDEYVDFKL